MSTYTTPATSKEEVKAAIAVRAEQRKALRDQKLVKAEELNAEGNKCFKKGEYMNALIFYTEAIKQTARPVKYWTNAAAVFLKTEDPDKVEEAATIALCIDPLNTKARYRRMQGRKQMKMYKGARCDAEALLRISPKMKEIEYEARELSNLIADPDYDSDEDTWDDGPNESIVDHTFDPSDDEDASDSEDAQHEGNHVPCRHYNHKGCAKGSTCDFSHAPDFLSVRDKLGKNVCAYFLLDRCKFGNERCNYSHSKLALPAQGWWSNSETRQEKEAELKALGVTGALKSRIFQTRWRMMKLRGLLDHPAEDQEEEPPVVSTSEKDNNHSRTRLGKDRKKNMRRRRHRANEGDDIFSHENIMELITITIE